MRNTSLLVKVVGGVAGAALLGVFVVVMLARRTPPVETTPAADVGLPIPPPANEPVAAAASGKTVLPKLMPTNPAPKSPVAATPQAPVASQAANPIANAKADASRSPGTMPSMPTASPVTPSAAPLSASTSAGSPAPSPLQSNLSSAPLDFSGLIPRGTIAVPQMRFGQASAVPVQQAAPVVPQQRSAIGGVSVQNGVITIGGGQPAARSGR